MKGLRDRFWFVLGTLFLLLIWELAARYFASPLILPGPLPVFRRFLEIVPTERFLRALGASFLRVCLGVLLSAPLGVLAGIAAGLDRRADYFLRPLLGFISATPVMALILIIFLWFGSEGTPVFTAFLMVFPVMAANTTAGVRAVDGNLRELCKVYRLSWADTLRWLYIPGILPFILGALRSSLSLAWKVIVAAEVLVQPLRALGTGMQRAKAQLETPELFAWTAATVIAAALSQLLLSLVLRIGRRGRLHA